MDFFNVVNDTQGLNVEGPTEVENDVVEVDAQTTETPAQEVTDPATETAANSWAKNLRQEYERQKLETQQTRQEHELLLSSLAGYGYTGTAQEIADMLAAQQQQTTPEQIKAQRAIEAQRAAEAVKTSPEYIAAMQRTAQLEAMAFDQIRKADLQAVNAANGTKFKDVSELGAQFAALRANGVDAVTAFAALKATEKPKPSAIGAINQSTPDKDFYTSDEVDKLTPAQLDNPKILEKVRKSMLRW